VKTEAQIRKELDDALLQSAAMENEAWQGKKLRERRKRARTDDSLGGRALG
jgi:hypothetical protein